MQLVLPLPELMLPTDGAYPPPLSNRIYCNRSLRLDQVEVVGFDMDYTLAIYHQDAMDRRSIEATARKLVARGYPRDLLSMAYRTEFPIRGLLIDRKLGNVLKMDRYKYVKRAYHGMRELTQAERRALYHRRRLRPSSERYHWVDTLYGLPEVSVYAAVVDALDRVNQPVDYDALFADVRASIDESHQDGSILDHVEQNLAEYVRRDPLLPHTLHKLRSGGKRLFLLTNSHAGYTDRMMTYLFAGEENEYPSWRHYFDAIVTAAKKPRFFTEREPFLEVGNERAGPARKLERGRIYSGGNIVDFEELTGVGGDQILYVGDHIYGDVLRAKRSSAWRTMMVVQEMDEELRAFSESRAALARADLLSEQRIRLHDELRERQRRLKSVQKRLEQSTAEEPALEAARSRHRRAIDRLRMRIRTLEEEHESIEELIDRNFHPFWGSLFKAGPETSSFGNQVEAYACLYTTRVSNLYRYSPMHFFQSSRDRMPHERSVEGATS